MKPVRRLALLDEYVGQWVAVRAGEVVAHASTSVGLAAVMQDERLSDALVQYVHSPSDAWIVGVG